MWPAADVGPAPDGMNGDGNDGGSAELDRLFSHFDGIRNQVDSQLANDRGLAQASFDSAAPSNCTPPQADLLSAALSPDSTASPQDKSDQSAAADALPVLPSNENAKADLPAADAAHAGQGGDQADAPRELDTAALRQADPYYSSHYGDATASVDDRIKASMANGRLPDTTGLSNTQKGELYSRMMLDAAKQFKGNALYEGNDRVSQAFDDGEAVQFGLRQPTELSANNGRGLWDDHMVVLQKQPDGTVKVLAETNYTADPAGSYQDGEPRPSYWGAGRGVATANAIPDQPKINGSTYGIIGRLHEGVYQYGWAKVNSKFGPTVYTDDHGNSYNVLRPNDNVPTDRYYNGTWNFDADSFNANRAHSSYSGQQTVYQHHGYNNFTGSAACQTFPFTSDAQAGNLSFGDLAKVLGDTKQSSFYYVLKNL
jgi:hypothetical protein